MTAQQPSNELQTLTDGIAMRQVEDRNGTPGVEIYLQDAQAQHDMNEIIQMLIEGDHLVAEALNVIKPIQAQLHDETTLTDHGQRLAMGLEDAQIFFRVMEEAGEIQRVAEQQAAAQAQST